MEGVAQLVRASDCGSEGRGFETPRSPSKTPGNYREFFCTLPLVRLNKSFAKLTFLQQQCYRKSVNFGYVLKIFQYDV
jgi:hypothetical protein